MQKENKTPRTKPRASEINLSLAFQKPAVELWTFPTAAGALAQNAETLDETLAAIARITTNQNGRKPERLFSSTIGGIISPIFDDSDFTNNNYGGHYSVLSTMNFGFMVRNLSRSTAAQLSRHNHNSPIQEFSTRYNSPIKDGIFNISSYCEIMRAGKTPRQGTDKPLYTNKAQQKALEKQFRNSGIAYLKAVKNGASLETAREILPLGTCTEIYVNFNLRTLITMLMQRLHHSAQAQFRDIANQIKDILIAKLPKLCEELNNFRFWGVIKGDDVISLTRYSKIHSLAMGVEPKDLIPFTILANNLNCSVCSDSEKAELKAVGIKYATKFTQIKKIYKQQKDLSNAK
jgi:flavin-dependent thymidylate synthase